ncbi:hypothetical protein B1J92_A02409g [Nakaseomyces glabratus]|nr:hypothetical protein B1J91_A02409g [Nakaseomyces glabratus]OXB50663.1 hypothetical protein B1J92_A02409g [Nakaseomyces glabratus]
MTGRPFSVNNPFRSAGMETRYQHDQQYQEWVRGNTSPSRGGSVSPPLGMAEKPVPVRQNTNPFLDDGDMHDSGHMGAPVQPVQPVQPVHSPPQGYGKALSAEEEKEQLRQKYQRDREREERPSHRRDLPPSYEEVAGGRGKGYPREKESYSGNVHREHSRSSGHREEYSRSAERAPHRHHSHRRHQDNSSPAKKEKRKNKVATPKNVDTIDKLDVTGLFGGSFHHDGPFDAVTPHRNKNTKAAPVLAFPADGPNSTIGGVTSKKSAMNEVFGVEEDDDDNDLYRISGQVAGSTTSVNTKDAIKPNVGDIKQMDIKSKTEKIHGPTTVGLGSTTFLDGAPASAAAIRQDIKQHSHTNRSGVQRHKSLSQRLGIGSDSSRPSRSDSYKGAGLSRTRSGPTEERPHQARHNSSHADDDEEDVYLGLPTSSLKKSSGSKFMKRVRSLKVGRK